jgi:DNA-binding IclR family transcriptional regulator
LRRITPYTITQPGRLRAQLVAVRRQGYATTAEEMSLGACSVGVPIRDRDEVIAALGIVVADLRRDRARLVAALHVAAQGVGRCLARADAASGVS